MRKSVFWISVLVALLLVGSLACNLGGEEEPTATPVPPTSPPPTATPKPSPTATPEKPAFEMISAESQTHGVRLCYPEGWFYADSFALVLSSDPEMDLTMSTGELPDSLVMLVMTGPSEDIEGEEMNEDAFGELASELGGDEVELLGEPEDLTINGAAVKRMGFRAQLEEGMAQGMVAIFIDGDWAAVFVAISPDEQWEEHADAVDAILECVELFEGTGLDFEMGLEDEPVWRGALGLGDVVNDSFEGGDLHSWTFEGAAGDAVTIILSPGSDGMDVSFQLLDPAGEILIEVDDTFDGKAETLEAYELPVDGEFTIVIQEFWDAPGEYELQLLDGALGTRAPSGDMIIAESESQGVRLAYPDGWFYNDTFFLFVASDPDAMMAMGDDISGLDAVLVVLIPFPAEDMEQESFEELYGEAGGMFGASEEAQVEIIGTPVETIINGAEVQIVDILTTEGELSFRSRFAIFNNGEQAAIALAVGPEDLWEENVDQVDAIIESIELFEGTGSMFDFDGTLYDEGVYRGDVAYGDLVEDEFESGEAHAWTFDGSAGDYVTIILTPLDDEMDVTVQLLSSELTGLTDRIDDGFSGEAETIRNYQLPADGEYRVVVDEYWDMVGPYQIEILGGDEPTGAILPAGVQEMGSIEVGQVVASSLASDEGHTWFLTVEGGEVVNIIATPVDDEHDLTVSLIAPDGELLYDEYDSAFSGEAEELMGLTLELAGDYLIIVEEYWGEAGSYNLVVEYGNEAGDEYELIEQGTIAFGELVIGSLPSGYYRDFWTFSGAAGDLVSIVVAPTSDLADLELMLVDPNGEIVFYIDDTMIDEPEQITSYELALTGVYGIGVDEWFGDPADYELTLTLE